MDRARVEDWLAGYQRAWRSDDPADIAVLFAEEASYSPYPFGGAWIGHDDIIDGWTGHRDSEKAWTFEHEIVAIDGRTAVIEGATHYPATGDEPATSFSNIWVVEFSSDGRARRFREWWVEQPR